MNYRMRAVARRDLREIAQFLARDDRSVAIGYVGAILAKIESIAEDPWLYATREEWGKEVRMAMIKSHRILFRVEGDFVMILRVYHSARDFDDLG